MSVRVGCAGVASAAALLAGCASSAPVERDPLLALPVPDHVVVSSAVLPQLGRVLVDGAGHALYEFPPDGRAQVRCTGACAGIWPPLVLAAGRDAQAGAQVDAARLGTLADPNTGARIVTYAGFPLYRYSGDLAAHTANGQALFSTGGPWYVLTPAGTPVTVHPSAG